MNLPNALTIMRLVLAPWIAWLLLERRDASALPLLLVSACSDYLDGLLARRWGQQTRFGAVADPLADKATVLLTAGVLALQGSLPWWLFVAALVRDLIIVAGATAYHVAVGPVQMAPLAVSKLNTVLQLVLLLGVLAVRAGVAPPGGWLELLVLATAVTIVASTLQYVLVWGHKARQAARRRRRVS